MVLQKLGLGKPAGHFPGTVQVNTYPDWAVATLPFTTFVDCKSLFFYPSPFSFAWLDYPP